jgi:hypothetical protein
VASPHVNEVVTVDTDELSAAIEDIFVSDTHAESISGSPRHKSSPLHATGLHTHD